MTSTIAISAAGTVSALEPLELSLAASNASPGLRRVVPTFIPSDEILYWTRRWQEGEAESAAARASGEAREFETGRDAVRWLLSEDD